MLLLSTTPVNRHGYVWSGLSAPCYRAIEEAGMVVAFVNPNVPVVFGETEIPIDCIDWLVEDDSPIGTFEPAPLSETDKVIGQYVASLVEDGSTIQLGIGGIPDAVAQAFMSKKDLGIHTEMITSSMADLWPWPALSTAAKRRCTEASWSAALPRAARSWSTTSPKTPASTSCRLNIPTTPPWWQRTTRCAPSTPASRST